MNATPGGGKPARARPRRFLLEVLSSRHRGARSADEAAGAAGNPLHDSVPVIPGLLNLVHVRNTGAAFGFLNAVDFPVQGAVVALVATLALMGSRSNAARLSSHERLARVGWRSFWAEPSEPARRLTLARLLISSTCLRRLGTSGVHVADSAYPRVAAMLAT